MERNLFWITDGTYQSAFLLTPDGVVVFDAPPTIGHNIQRAVDEFAAAEGMTNRVTHLVYSHHHADHAGAANLFGSDVVFIGHEETRRLLLRDNDPTRPVPEVTFEDSLTLEVGGERVELSFHGPNHSPDNIFIHFPDHDTLMLIDIVNAGWVPIFNLNLTEDVPGLHRRTDHGAGLPVESLHRRSPRAARDARGHRAAPAVRRRHPRQHPARPGSVDPTPFFVKYGVNAWAGVRTYLDTVTAVAAEPVIAKYTGVLAAADVKELTYTTTFHVMQSLRLDVGVGSQVHP